MQGKGIKIALFSTVPETVAAQCYLGNNGICADLGGRPRAEGFGDSPQKWGSLKAEGFQGQKPQGSLDRRARGGGYGAAECNSGSARACACG